MGQDLHSPRGGGVATASELYSRLRFGIYLDRLRPLALIAIQIPSKSSTQLSGGQLQRLRSAMISCTACVDPTLARRSGAGPK